MQEPASILKTDGDPAVEMPPGQDQRRRGPLKFAYASGSQPLPGYTIKRGIGAGGFGDVYYATSDSGKEVALKRIQRNLDVELRGVTQCLNLKHPNLLVLYDIRYDDQHQAWVIMEYVAGESLQDVIERNPNGMPLDDVNRWFVDIARGLAYLHDHGIVHRDLKPGNIFSDQGLVKIGDYGLSKFISCSRRSGQTESVGTFHYMAPEIGLGRYGKEIDIYALGILLYEMITGHVPFDGESSQEIIMKHLTAEPRLDRLPAPYRRVVGRALAKDPAQRYQAVAEMLADLGLSDAGRPRGPVHQPHAAAVDPVIAQLIHPGGFPPFGQDVEEPIARFVLARFQSLRTWWNGNRLNSPAQIVLLVVAVVLLVSNARWLVPMCFGLAVGYGAYFVVWSLVRPKTSRLRPHAPTAPYPYPDPARSEPVAAVQAPTNSVAARRARRTPTKQQLQDAYRDWLAGKTFTQHAAELTGSMLMSALAAAVLCIPMLLIGSRNLEPTVASWGPLYAWLTITSAVAAWCVLGLGKFWEGTAGDQALRRFSMMACGLGVGALAAGLARLLLLEPTYLWGAWEAVPHALGHQVPALYEVTGTPRTLAYMGYFGGLFLLLRWWLQADPLRASRLGVLATGVAVVAAIALHNVIPIPHGFLVAAIVAVSVQLAAPWVDHRQRRQLRREWFGV